MNQTVINSINVVNINETTVAKHANRRAATVVERSAFTTSARVDRAALRDWFRTKKIESLNTGQPVPARSPNTDFFPRDEYYLNRP